MSLHQQVEPPPRKPQRGPKRLWQLLGISVITSTVLLLGTNPNQSAYTSYAAENLPKHLKKTNCDELEGHFSFGFFSGQTKDACKSAINGADSIGRGIIQFFIDQSTERTNLHVLSIYTTEVFGRKITTLGIGQQFWTL